MSQSLDIDLLRSFVAIAETGVLGQAALRVGRTQSALSMQMQRLEGIVEQPLLHRTGRGVTLTATGERLLVRAGELLRKHDEALAELRGEQLSGVLRFSCPDDYAVVFLPYLLQGFASLHPRVQLEVMCAPTPRLHELLARHAVDLALVSVSVAEAGGAVGGEVIRHEPLVWVAQRGGAAARSIRCRWRWARPMRWTICCPGRRWRPQVARTGWPMPAAACRAWSAWRAPAWPSSC